MTEEDVGGVHILEHALKFLWHPVDLHTPPTYPSTPTFSSNSAGVVKQQVT